MDRKTTLPVEDVLKMSTEQYLAELASQGEVNLLVHALRQGVRDHVGHWFHTRGLGEVHDGFKTLVSGDARLRSRFDYRTVQEGRDAAIRHELCLDIESTAEEVKGRLESSLDRREHLGIYPNFTSIHFASNAVADWSYGAEIGNEVFVAFPSVYLAQETLFTPSLGDHGDGYGSDVWVWKREGLPVEAGFIFLPEDTLVDPRNGSRYDLSALPPPEVFEGKHFQARDLPLAKRPIPARDFWQGFLAGLERKSEAQLKVIFYNGEPTRALKKWRSQNLPLGYSGIDHGYTENYIPDARTDDRVWVGSEEYARRAREILTLIGV